MQQYIDLCERIYNEGVDVENPDRPGVICRTVINANFNFDCRDNKFTPITVRKAPMIMPTAEQLGYWKALDNAEAFDAVGAKTWYANANENAKWLNNPVRKGENDLGQIYGYTAQNWPVTNQDGEVIGKKNLFQDVYNDLKNGIDNRGEIITYWNPGNHHNGALRPCLHTYQYSLLDGYLYLTAQQRSVDSLLGLVANCHQVQEQLILMAHITGHKPGFAQLNMVNCHMYANQISLYERFQRGRKPIENDLRMYISDEIKTLDDVVNKMTTNHVIITGEYKHHDSIKYPFQA